MHYHSTMKNLGGLRPLWARGWRGMWVRVTLLGAACLTTMSGAAQGLPLDAAAYTSPQATVTLVAHAPQGVGPGQPMWLGLRIKHAPGWHTYWRNSGDSGLPTTLDWTLPKGWSAGDVAWPAPIKFFLGPLANYGYEGDVLLSTPVTVADGSAGPWQVALRAQWLSCRKECIPEEADLRLTLPAGASLGTHTAVFESNWARVPSDVASPQGQALPTATRLKLRVPGLPAAWVGQALEVFPETEGLIVPGDPWQQAWVGDVFEADLPLSPFRQAQPTQLPVVVTPKPVKGAEALGVRVTLPVVASWPPVNQPAAMSSGLSQALQQPTANTDTLPLAMALVWALLGGALLNLMPCVFPVLAIKGLALAQPTHSSAHRRQMALAYGGGVVFSFLILAGLFLGLRAAGEAVGWGFQLQSPTVVALLALWFVVLGLQLAGLFEWGAVLPSAMSDMRWRRPSVEAAWSGVLATVAASPCTAPFMGAALGATLLMTTFESLLVFAALGVGMALPFMALAWWPGLTRRLPKPGAWMQTFKQFLAFPMLATSIWLVWVLGQQTGIGGAAALLLLMLAVAWVLWLWYRVTARHWRLAGLLLVLLGAFSLWPTVVQPLARAADPTVAQADAQGRWQAWSQAKVDAALARGESVFVDFTAAWCVTCQFNERTALAAPEVWQQARQSNVLMLRADWTSRDDAITRALAALGRSGVPTYALYRPNQPPVLLPELLTTSIVLAALPQ